MIILTAMLTTVLSGVLASYDAVHAAEFVSPQERVIAVGFGHQEGSTSTIRIRTYGMVQGEMLSEDVFDLNVVGDDASAGDASGERIFAGAVDITDGGLGNFPMRVYDAKTGRFLWHGHLNFIDAAGADPHQRVDWSGDVNRDRPVARLVADVEPVHVQSQVWVRAVDPVTGVALWQQSFVSLQAMAEAIGSEESPSDVDAQGLVADFEVVVRSYDKDSGRLMWSDRLSTRDQVSDLSAIQSPEHAQTLPLFPLMQGEDKVWM
ncbi:MAG: hypothetical protein U0172_05155 [Nitrospiraceae bacterium]